MTRKLAISVPDELAAEARRAVARGEAPSVSAYVAAAMDSYRNRKTLDEWLDEVDAEVGAPSPEAYRRAREALGVSQPKSA